MLKNSNPDVFQVLNKAFQCQKKSHFLGSGGTAHPSVGGVIRRSQEAEVALQPQRGSREGSLHSILQYGPEVFQPFLASCKVDRVRSATAQGLRLHNSAERLCESLRCRES